MAKTVKTVKKKTTSSTKPVSTKVKKVSTTVEPVSTAAKAVSNTVTKPVASNLSTGAKSMVDLVLTSLKASEPKLNKTTTLPTYEQNKPSDYQSPYSNQIQNILTGIQNNQPFTYSMNADPLYQQYSQQYQRQGNLAMRDTMGNAAALTGGYGNSYASIAGQQAYDANLQELNDKVPELYQLAYDKYNNDLNNKYNELSALQSADQQSYNQYRNKVSDWQTDRAYGYGKDQDALTQKNWQDQFDYGKSQDAQSQSNWNTEFDYNKSQDTKNYNYQKKLDDRNYSYQKSQDAQSQSNWNKEYNYNASQDAQSQSNANREYNASNSKWQQEFNYNKQQDALDRADAKAEKKAETKTAQTQASAQASAARVKSYTSSVNKMLSATKKDNLGNTIKKYKTSQVWDYLYNSGLSDDEIAEVVNDNYELRKYAEKLMK